MSKMKNSIMEALESQYDLGVIDGMNNIKESLRKMLDDGGDTVVNLEDLCERLESSINLIKKVR